MEQVYVTNMERMEKAQEEQTYELNRIADWLVVVAEEMRYANAMTRASITSVEVADVLNRQGY